ncbi:MAG: beta-lactamase family protein [Deltaproteobacteria bacterium]|nr:beta-lactamase family protein [Deltaproteobacteria bacterium]
MKSGKGKVCLLSFVLLFFLLAFTQAVTAQTKDETKPEAYVKVAAEGLKNTAEVEAFFDNLVPKLLEKYHVPGGAISLVKDGKLLFAKGYGFANLDTGKPVHAGETLFRIASISKLFTWIAVMQQVEAGTIDLDADVNRYLKRFKIPETFPGRPVTMRHLMTHTAGFDDHIEPRIYSKDPSDLEPLWVFLKRTWPPQIRPPGEISVYSNYGTCLAALIVEEVSGMALEEYIGKRITRPLGMNRTTIAQPLPGRLASGMSVGYVYGKDGHVPQEFELVRVAPAGAVSTTATDMAKFMIAQLQLGRYGDERILGEAAAREMQSPQFSPAPRVNSICLGIYETPLHGLRMIGHAGDTVFFHSNLFLIPQEQVGLFVTCNSPGGSPLRNDLRTAFLDRYYPVQDAPRPPNKETQQRIPALEGTYESMIYNATTIEKYLFPLLQFTIKATPKGTMMASFRKYVSEVEEVKPYTFRSVTGVRAFHGDQVFVRNPEGHVTHYYLANAPFLPFKRIPLFATTRFVDMVKIICIAVFLSVFIWPVRAIIRKREKLKEIDAPILGQTARWVTGSAAILLLLFVLLLSTMMSQTNLVEQFLTSISVPPALILLLVMPIIAAALTLFVIPLNVLAWVKKYWTFQDRIHYTLLTAALVAFMWWLDFYNLLGWRF